jgi:hypothetical protein
MVFKLTLLYADGFSAECEMPAPSLTIATYWARMIYREAVSITVEAA